MSGCQRYPRHSLIIMFQCSYKLVWLDTQRLYSRLQILIYNLELYKSVFEFLVTCRGKFQLMTLSDPYQFRLFFSYNPAPKKNLYFLHFCITFVSIIAKYVNWTLESELLSGGLSNGFRRNHIFDSSVYGILEIDLI